MKRKRNSILVTKKSLRSAEHDSEKRPRRTVQPKIVDDTVGLSRREEQDLNKALYASLHESRRSKSLPSLTEIGKSNFPRHRESSKRLSGSKSDKANARKRTLRGHVFSSKRLLRKSDSSSDLSRSNLNSNLPSAVLNIDESSQDSIKSSSSSVNGSKRKIHAQRKFAQNAYLPGAACNSSVKPSSTPVKLWTKIPKTEDFLSFLCLRGTSVLPPHLDFFNYSREEVANHSRANGKKNGREGTPESTSTNSSANDEMVDAEASSLTPTNRVYLLESRQSAARASAGTPETARGIISLRQGLQRKVSHSTSSSSASSNISSSTYRPRLSTNPVMRCSNKFYFTPDKCTLPRRNSGVLPGEFTPPKSTAFYKCSSVGRPRLSPLVCSPGHSHTPSTRSSSSASPASSNQSRKTTSSLSSQGYFKTTSAGAFTPLSNRSQKSTPSSSGSRSKRGQAVVGADGVKSVRKSLLSKLTSVARQALKGQINKSIKSKRLVKRLGMRTRSGGKDQTLTRRRMMKKYMDYELDDEIEEKPVQRRKKKRQSLKNRKPKRRISSRLQELSHEQSIYKRSQSLEFQKTNENIEVIDNKKVRESRSGRKKSPVIKPPERVRTRGYSSMLVSKMALKRAKRETSKRIKAARKKEDEVDGDISVEPVHENHDKDHGKKITHKHLPKAKKVVNVTDSPSRVKKGRVSTSDASGTKECCDEVPTFQPTEEEFEDPLAYINQIQAEAEPYGLCKVIPPASWKMESKLMSEDIRFTSQVQHIHRLYQRWGPNVKHTAAISQHRVSAANDTFVAPQIGGVEIDLPELYKLVEDAGGLSKMADKKHWARVADVMNVPKQAMDRTMRLYDIYCRHILPYATLSKHEKSQLDEEVQNIHEMQTNEDEAITRGKSMSASWFHRISRNIQSMWFKEDPSPEQVEAVYWRVLENRDKHVAVQCGHINTRAQASGFPTRRENSYSKHNWNLNNLPYNERSVLKYLGPTSGVTIPTLHLGMLFSTSCWSVDPHAMPYVQYLHTGAPTLWYSIAKSQKSKLRSVVTDLCPTLVCNKPKWLKEDVLMVKPSLLSEKGLKVNRCAQLPRQFVVVFPGTFTSTISCGYNASESVHFATAKWFQAGLESALALTKSGENELFSMSSLLCCLAQDKNVNLSILSEALPLLSSIIYKELDLTTQLEAAGLRAQKGGLLESSPASGVSRKRSSSDQDKYCDVCHRVCFLSLVTNETDDQMLCLEHGLKLVQRRKQIKSFIFYQRYSQVIYNL